MTLAKLKLAKQLRIFPNATTRLMVVEHRAGQVSTITVRGGPHLTQISQGLKALQFITKSAVQLSWDFKYLD